MTKAEEQRKKFADFQKDPDYAIELVPHGRPVRAVRNGTVLAESDAAIDLLETRHRPVVYFPRTDVNTHLLTRTGHATHCPYKGDASYWSVTGAGEAAENAVWSYEDPIQDVAGMKDYVAFYSDDMGAGFDIRIEDA